MQPFHDQPSANNSTNQPTDYPTSRRVTVPEAATLLGISQDAVRSRLKRGTLRREKMPDGTVLVSLGDATNDRPMTDSSANRQPDQPTDQRPTDELVEVLRDQVDHLRDQLQQEREANRENRRIIAGLVQRVPELEPAGEAPPDAQNGPGAVSEDEERVETTPEQEHDSRAWWEPRKSPVTSSCEDAPGTQASPDREQEDPRAEAGRLKAELEAERSKGFWRRLFGG